MITFMALFVGFGTGVVSAEAAAPGCYKISAAKPAKLDQCPPGSQAVYDNGSGGNLAGPAPDKCYVFSQNLYDGDKSFGDPYVQVDCASLAACPENQELRYSTEKLGPPSCVSASVTPGGNFVSEGGKSEIAATDPTCNGKGSTEALNNCYAGNPLVKRFDMLINILSAAVGFAVVIMVIVGGIQYITAGSNPQAVAAARKKILNAVIALFSLLLLYSFMQWLVPGGIFN